MFYFLLDFFYTLFNWADSGNDVIGDAIADFMSAPVIYKSPIDESFGQLDWQSYFALILALISEIVIVILCCLFVWKIVKLIGGLITR